MLKDGMRACSSCCNLESGNYKRLRLGFVHPLQDVALHQCLSGLSDLFVFLSSLMGFWPTINALARRVVDGFFIRYVLTMVL